MPIKGTPAGGGYSTVEDLLNFSNALLGHRPSPESTELLLAGKVEVREGSQYACGFFDMTFGGQREVGHGGGAPGVCTFLEMYLDSGYTVVVLSNTDQGCFPVLELLREHLLAPPQWSRGTPLPICSYTTRTAGQPRCIDEMKWKSYEHASGACPAAPNRGGPKKRTALSFRFSPRLHSDNYSACCKVRERRDSNPRSPA
jgi:hypothetical protein